MIPLAPEARAPNTENPHLKRLELIKALQKERLTLEEIGARLQSLDEEGVVRELDHLTRNRESAADYARSIRLAGDRPARLEEAAQRAVSGTTPRSRGAWERIALSPGVELHIRSPLSHRQTKLVSRLVELADRLVNTQEGV